MGFFIAIFAMNVYCKTSYTVDWRWAWGKTINEEKNSNPTSDVVSYIFSHFYLQDGARHLVTWGTSGVSWVCGTWSASLLKDTLQVSHVMFHETFFYIHDNIIMEYNVTKRSIIMTYCTLTKVMLNPQDYSIFNTSCVRNPPNDPGTGSGISLLRSPVLRAPLTNPQKAQLFNYKSVHFHPSMPTASNCF